MRHTILGAFTWDRPPCTRYIDVFPSSRDDFALALGGYEHQLQGNPRRRAHRSIGQAIPQYPQLVSAQHSVALVFFPWRLHLSAGVGRHEIARQREVEHSPYHSKCTVGRDRRAAIHNPVQQRDNVAARDLFGLAPAPKRQDILVENSFVLLPRALAALRPALEVLRRKISQSRL